METIMNCSQFQFPNSYPICLADHCQILLAHAALSSALPAWVHSGVFCYLLSQTPPRAACPGHRAWAQPPWPVLLVQSHCWPSLVSVPPKASSKLLRSARPGGLYTLQFSPVIGTVEADASLLPSYLALCAGLNIPLVVRPLAARLVLSGFPAPLGALPSHVWSSK